MDHVDVLFSDLLRKHGMELSEEQLRQFAIYYRELTDWNERMNLTGITEREQVYVKHFYDSLSLAFYMDLHKVGSLADIGSGAGFPSIPLKIMFPHVKVTIVDSLNKRIVFLRHLTEALDLQNVDCVHGRAEEAARKPEHRDRYDLVTARAVARLNVLNEFCLPFVKPGGWFAAMKGSTLQEEVQEAEFSLRELKGELGEIYAFTLPVEEAARHIVTIRKTAATPKKYPRKPGTPLRSPLVRV